MHLFPMPSFMFLFLENYGVRKLEAVFAVLISTMALSFVCMFAETKPSGKELLTGKDKHACYCNYFFGEVASCCYCLALACLLFD